MDAQSWFGPYQLVRPLDPARLGPLPPTTRRWAAVHDREHTGHLVYSLGPARDRFSKKRFLAAADRLAPLRHPHLLTINAYALSDKLGACIVAPYPGHTGGIVSLAELIDHKGGRMSSQEAQRAVTHLLDGITALHAAGFADGALGLDRIHVDPRGSLLIELPGLHRALGRHEAPTPDDHRADLQAIASMAHQMLAGAPPLRGLPRLPEDTDPRWRIWCTQALDPIEGFATSAQALGALPTNVQATAEQKPTLVRSLLDKLRSVIPLL
jgi:hypothetical protein